MTTQTSSRPRGRVRQVGKVFTALTISNRTDETDVKRGRLSPDQLRSITLQDVLVDTGASTLSLPMSMVERLGLSPSRQVEVQTAKGISTAMIYDDAWLTVLGRSATFECIGLSDEAVPLLGVIPLEVLGLELDLQQEILRARPETGRDTHLSA
ncbi:MAG TPA: retroviral-like aspartic protease family protein [Tepidiformaceae bacterium]|nr:retroviral-like aspartic protease family protein [Tepidiformaceae bacterium]